MNRWRILHLSTLWVPLHDVYRSIVYVYGMIDSSMDIMMWAIRNVVVRSPLITIYGCAWSNILMDYGQEGSSITLIDKNSKTLSSISINPAGNPLICHKTSSIILSLSPSKFINVYNISNSSYLQWMFQKIVATNVSHKIFPINNCALTRHSTMTSKVVMRVELLRPEIH